MGLGRVTKRNNKTASESLHSFNNFSNILDFPLPIASGSTTSSSIEMTVYENEGAAVEILSLFCTAADRWGLFHTRH